MKDQKGIRYIWPVKELFWEKRFTVKQNWLTVEDTGKSAKLILRSHQTFPPHYEKHLAYFSWLKECTIQRNLCSYEINYKVI